MLTSIDIELTCPHCDEKMDCVTKLNGKEEKPKSGSFSLCWSCLGLSRFSSDLKLEKVTEEEFKQLDENLQVHIKSLQGAIYEGTDNQINSQKTDYARS